MALTTYRFNDPFFSHMDRAMERAMEHALQLAAPGGKGAQGGSTIELPGLFRSVSGSHPMDVIETDKAYELHVDAPGMKPENIAVELQDGVLTIKGERSDSKEEKDSRGKVHRQERLFTKFTRSFTLPENSEPERITAKLDMGVLKLVVPKREPTPKPQPKRIAVQAAAEAA